jgi:hypothetical protein
VKPLRARKKLLERGRSAVFIFLTVAQFSH